MLMNKIVPYPIRKKLLKVALFASPLLFAPSCGDKDEPIVQHDVTLDWGVGNFDNVYPVSKVAAAAKPEDVRYVYVKVSDTPWGVSTDYLRKNLLDELFDSSPKVRGAGNFWGVECSSKSDSLLFIQWGFKFKQNQK